MKIVHISDTHGERSHSKLEIPKCDLLIHTGDIGGRTSPVEVYEFVKWFSKQPAKHKVFIAGNHDICLDVNFKTEDKELNDIHTKQYKDSQKIIEKFSDVIYLKNSGCEIEGYKIWGSPYSPSFYRQHWAFNADRGPEIAAIWDKIPDDTDILLTHGPSFGMLDWVPRSMATSWNINGHVGCEDLDHTIKYRLTELKLHCYGHIHSNTAIRSYTQDNRRIRSSNGAVLDNDYELILTEPLIINL